MKELAVFIALNHSGSFGMNFVKFEKNNTYFFSEGTVMNPAI